MIFTHSATKRIGDKIVAWLGHEEDKTGGGVVNAYQHEPAKKLLSNLYLHTCIHDPSFFTYLSTYYMEPAAETGTA